MPEINAVLLSGRLTRDPEVFFTQAGVAKCSFSIAVNRRVKDAKTGEWKDDVFFMPIVVWREQAERCKDKLRKGSPVHVEGRLRGREYEDKSGQKRSVLEVEASRIQFLALTSTGEPKEGAAPKTEEAASERLEEVPF